MSPYCHCGAKFTYGEVKLAPASWQSKMAQYCGTCGKLSHAIQDKRPDMYAPHRGYAPLGYSGKADGTYIQQWATEVSGERIEVTDYIPYSFVKVNDVDQGRNHLLKLWQKLDFRIDTIRGPEPVDVELHKQAAMIYAEVIAQLMAPFYADSKAVLAESMKRWKARQEGITDHQTPGLAERLWDPTERTLKMKDTPKKEPAKSAPRKTGNTIPPAAVNTVKAGIESGMFTAKQMADSYNMSVPELKEQLGLA